MGIPTASNFKRLITPAGKVSKSTGPYMAELLAEHFSGEPFSDFENEWTEHGKRYEEEARSWYEFETECEDEITAIGFVYADESRMVGGSPDALVGDDGLLELKCPMLKTHLYWHSSERCPNQHCMQCQGALWITGREWIDFASYVPEQPMFVTRILPDPAIFAALDKAVPAFIDEILRRRERLVKLGYERR